MVAIAAAGIGAAGAIGGAAISANAASKAGKTPTFAPFKVQGQSIANLGYSLPGGYRFDLGTDANGLLTATAKREYEGQGGAYEEFVNRFPRILQDYDTVRNQLRPGFGVLTQQTDIAGRRALGDLRSSLSRRKVLGSSFANDALSRVEAEFNNQRNLAALAELEAYQSTVTQEFNVLQTELNRQLSEAGFASNTIASMLNTLGAGASQLAQSAASPLGGALSALGGQAFGFGAQSLANKYYPAPTQTQTAGSTTNYYDDIYNPATSGVLGNG